MSSRSVVPVITGISVVISTFFKIIEHIRAIDFLDEVENSGSFAVIGSWLGTPIGAAIVAATIVGLLLAVGVLWRAARVASRGVVPIPQEIVEEERVEEIHTKRTIRRLNKA